MALLFCLMHVRHEEDMWGHQDVVAPDATTCSEEPTHPGEEGGQGAMLWPASSGEPLDCRSAFQLVLLPCTCFYRFSAEWSIQLCWCECRRQQLLFPAASAHSSFCSQKFLLPATSAPSSGVGGSCETSPRSGTLWESTANKQYLPWPGVWPFYESSRERGQDCVNCMLQRCKKGPCFSLRRSEIQWLSLLAGVLQELNYGWKLDMHSLAKRSLREIR